MKSEFLFTACQVGAEKVLKEEFLRDYPQFKFSFSRPGFVTFKCTQGPVPLDYALNSVFARVYGTSFGMMKAHEAHRVLELIRSLKEEYSSDLKFKVHFWERDQHLPGEEPLGFERGRLIHVMEAQVRGLLQGESAVDLRSTPPRQGECVVQVIALDEGSFALGAYFHSPHHSLHPGGRSPIQMPKEAPSRAYLKLEEVISWYGIPIRRGDIAVEAGSAPGGASFALLKRGVSVVGIDPGVMDPRVLDHPQFEHIQMQVNRVLREGLPESVQWLLLDMNVDPSISLFAIDRLASRMKESLLGVILTVKMNDWKFAREIPHMIEHVQAMGMVRVKAAQLAYHRREIVIFGLSRKGKARWTSQNAEAAGIS